MQIHIFRPAPLIFVHLADHCCTDNEKFSTALLDKIKVSGKYQKVALGTLSTLKTL